MDYNEFLGRVIDKGIAAVKADYSPDDNRREGSIKGFEECRGKSPAQLRDMLIQARKEVYEKFIDTQDSDKKGVDEYWALQGRASEIEWVCNCVSAMLVISGKPEIIPPTARGTIHAAKILGAG